MAERCPIPVMLYLLLARLAGPLYRLLHFIRCRTGKDDTTRSGEKFGSPGLARTAGPLVWIHAASVGETTSVLPLIEVLTGRNIQVLLTTVTRTSAELARQRLPSGAVHQYAPFDCPQYWNRFLKAWRPDLAITVESEIWPACFLSLRAHGCPLCLVNGRMSERSFRGWSRVPRSARFIFGQFAVALAQSPAEAARLKTLGCARVGQPGNLKFDSVPADPDPAGLEDLKSMIAGRPVWLAALTHPGEEQIVLSAHRDLLAANPELLLLLVPRHPERAGDIIGLIEELGLSVARRSAGDPVEAGTQVYLGDTLGEMSLFYSLSEVVFLGGSFSDAGGHNPVEAAAFDTAIMTGPKVANARPVYKSLWQDEGALRLDHPGELAGEISRLLQDEEARQVQARAAREIIDSGRGALERTLDLLEPYLPSSPGSGKET